MRFSVPHKLTSSPTVSVVIPCYNYGLFLPDAVSSVLNQSRVAVEVLIVDDASTDGSADVARSLARADDRVRLVLHERNIGHIETYNEGLAKVSGDYVSVLSADDLLTPDALSRAVGLMEHHRSVGFVYGVAKRFPSRPRQVGMGEVCWRIWEGADWIRLATVRARNLVTSPTAVMRREALDDAGGYDPRLPHAADYDIWLRTAARWDVGRIYGAPQALYRVHGSNMSVTTYGGKMTDLLERRKMFETLFDEHWRSDPELSGMRGGVMKALAREAASRVLVSEESDPFSAQDYLEYAESTHGDIRSTVLWKLCESSAASDGRLPVARFLRLGGRVRRSVRWRSMP